jgi:uncharacterized protein (DUF1330 family)
MTFEVMADGPSPPETEVMTAYAIAQLRTVDQNDDIVDYLRRIDDTLLPFDGQFLVHGTIPEVIDGDLPGTLVVIAFPDPEQAHAWYRSADYQRILPLRLDNSEGGAVIVDGVPPGYRAATFADRILLARGPSEHPRPLG